MTETVYKKYYKINNDDSNTHIKVTIVFSTDTYSPTSASVSKGYSVIVYPVKKEEHGKYSTESMSAYSGFKKHLITCNRRSKGNLEKAIATVEAETKDYLKYFNEKKGFDIEGLEQIIYITFGQSQVHVRNGITLDHDIVGIIKATSYDNARKLAFEWFGSKFATTYTVEEFGDNIKYFPRGFIELN